MRDTATASIVTFEDPYGMRGDRAIAGAAIIHQPAPDDAIRRGRDVAISLLLLLLTLPIVLVVACLIKLESPGPVFYRQQRTGLHGRGFTLWKFRSMRMDAEASGACWASQRDPRVTRIGAFMRAHRIDELPQLANVLRGEMSLIGPRPERPIFVKQLVQAMPDFAARAQVLPGVTGWAQVNYPYGASVEDARIKLDYDLFYIRNRSLLLDLRILLRTVGVVLLRTGSR
jgi:exopolysaccharide biosynthesis polyprenyl glycosylphosphotransferase